MRQIIAIAWKDTLLRFSSRSELVFFIILPVVFTLILGGGLSKLGQSDNRVPVLVTDDDHSALSAELVQQLAGSATVRVVALDAPRAAAEFARNGTPAWVSVPAGFGAALSAGTPVALGVRSLPNNVNALAAQRAISLAASQVGQALEAASASTAEAERLRPFASAGDRQAYFEASLRAAQAAFAAAPSGVQLTHPAASPAPDFNGNAQASAGQLITWVFIPLLGTSSLFAFERSTGTLRRLLTTPVGKATYLLGTIAGQLSLALVQMLLLVVFGSLALGLTWGSSPAGLAAVALGTLLGTFVRTESQANGASMALGMSLALLGGCWYPLELFPSAARAAARVLPTAWAMQGLNNLLLRGAGLAGVLPQAGVLLGFAAVFFAVGVWRFRYE